MSDQPLRFHPFADVFPMMDGRDFSELVDDIRDNGLDQHITVDGQNRILDGRNRYNACLRAGVPPRFHLFQGEDPLQFVVSRNMRRRHLNESQRALIAARITEIQSTASLIAVTMPAKEAAELLNVSQAAVLRAKKLIRQQSPELIAAVDRGDIQVSTAINLAEATPEMIQLALSEPRRAHTFAKRIRRQDREKKLAERTRLASYQLGRKLYSVIWADPPWRFEPWSRDTGMDRSADNHYPTMTIDGLRKLRMPAYKSCALFLWTTVPMAEVALNLMKRWGFQYRSQWAWIKDKPGTGYWNRNQHEIFLLGIRGSDVPAPAPGTQLPSIIYAPATQHSVKPPAFYEMVDLMLPSQRPLEMFARGVPRAGWDNWGNETETGYAHSTIGDPEFHVPWPEDIQEGDFLDNPPSVGPEFVLNDSGHSLDGDLP